MKSPTKVLARLPTFAVSVKEIYQFSPLPHRDEVVVARFQHCRGGEVPYSSDAISYCFQIACQRMLQLSDPGVPRTFVKDCS